MKNYDIAIIGAGVTGCMVAFEAKSRGLKVVIIDRASTPATGGSGAAGAFISPKLGKPTPLLELTNLAYSYASSFYINNFSKYFDSSGIVRLPKNSDDATNFEYYRSIINEPSSILKKEELEKTGIKNQELGLYFKGGGVCDAQGLCRALIKDIDYLQFEVKDISSLPIKATNMVLATGYEGFKDYLTYMGINGTWGSRGDFYTDSKIDVCMHKSVSVSVNKDGVIKIGATHTRARGATNACMKCNGKPLDKLLVEAKELVDLKELKLKETLCGMRSASKDHIPVVGRVIDTKYMLEKYPKILKGYKKAPLKYIDNLYILNGLGGRGFVLAPLMAKWLVDLIIKNKEIEKTVNPNRLFLRWARRLNAI